MFKIWTFYSLQFGFFNFRNQYKTKNEFIYSIVYHAINQPILIRKINFNFSMSLFLLFFLGFGLWPGVYTTETTIADERF